MAALTDFAEKKILDWTMTGAAVTRPTGWVLALFTTATNDAGGGTEVVGNGYSRQPVSFNAANSPGGTTSNSAEVSFTAAGGDWGTITHAALVDGSGNMWWHGALASSRLVNDGDTLSFAAGAIDLTMA